MRDIFYNNAICVYVCAIDRSAKIMVMYCLLIVHTSNTQCFNRYACNDFDLHVQCNCNYSYGFFFFSLSIRLAGESIYDCDGMQSYFFLKLPPKLIYSIKISICHFAARLLTNPIDQYRFKWLISKSSHPILHRWLPFFTAFVLFLFSFK